MDMKKWLKIIGEATCTSNDFVGVQAKGWFERTEGQGVLLCEGICVCVRACS